MKFGPSVTVLSCGRAGTCAEEDVPLEVSCSILGDFGGQEDNGLLVGVEVGESNALLGGVEAQELLCAKRKLLLLGVEAQESNSLLVGVDV